MMTSWGTFVLYLTPIERIELEIELKRILATLENVSVRQIVEQYPLLHELTYQLREKED